MQSHVATFSASPFTVIEGNPTAYSTSAIDHPEEADVGIFRPGIFYFRRRLDDCSTARRAIEVASVIGKELDWTRRWMAKNELPSVVHPMASAIVAQLGRCSDATSAKAMGFLLCSELERVRSWLSEHDYPIPKLNVDRDEAEARGWAN